MTRGFRVEIFGKRSACNRSSRRNPGDRRTITRPRVSFQRLPSCTPGGQPTFTSVSFSHVRAYPQVFYYVSLSFRYPCRTFNTIMICRPVSSSELFRGGEALTTTITVALGYLHFSHRISISPHDPELCRNMLNRTLAPFRHLRFRY